MMRRMVSHINNIIPLISWLEIHLRRKRSYYKLMRERRLEKQSHPHWQGKIPLNLMGLLSFELNRYG